MLQLRPGNQLLHARTRAKSKMYEFAVPEERHINLEGIDLTSMLDITIGLLGELSARNNTNANDQEKYYLLFSAQYFTSLLESRSVTHNHTLLKLLASSSYYLSGYPGSSTVILDTINNDTSLDLMEEILFSVLKRNHFPQVANNLYEGKFATLRDQWAVFISGFGNDTQELESNLTSIRSDIYACGSDKEVLLIDVVRSIIIKRIQNSAHKILSLNSGVIDGLWHPYFEREGSIKEFWPSQIKLANSGVYSGMSAVIQMPTSAGKTRSTEFIIRSSFLAERSNIAVIVAPYRSLCQEIFNDFSSHFELDIDVHLEIVSDVMQGDLSPLANNIKSILILTPEKLDYLIRQEPEVAERIGLIIYDEGHLFDDMSRGTKYELLLSSLKQKLTDDTQVVLISAVISNAQQVKDWLMGQAGVLIDGSDLSPTSRNIAFAEWSTNHRNLQFVNPSDINESLFWVPTILKMHRLDSKPRETVARYFPDQTKIPQIACYLGCRLAPSGLTAVFTATKVSAQKMLRDVVDAFERNIDIEKPSDFSENPEEASKVVRYLADVLGENSENVAAARLGLLCHHASIPHGLRLVTEHSLSKSYFKSVVCTSTLAQGVNLPIRYLVIASDRQAQEKIKTRDFHNLMGRAGRSGKYTEGTVIFANPKIYKDRNRGGRWSDVSELLDSSNAEPSVSRLHFLLIERPQDPGDAVIWEQTTSIIKDAVYAYLLEALIDVEEVRIAEEIAAALVVSTLGYEQLQSDEERAKLTEIFVQVGREIIQSVPDRAKRVVYTKSILNAADSESLIELMNASFDELVSSANNQELLLSLLWPHLYAYSNSKILKKFDIENSLNLCNEWIRGVSFPDIYSMASSMEHQPIRSFSVNSIVDLCEGSFSYDMSTLLGTIVEFLDFIDEANEGANLKSSLSILQKRLKYGVSSYIESIVYELGFVDRSLTRVIAAEVNQEGGTIFRDQVKRRISESEEVRHHIENDYPEYFTVRLDQLR